MSPDEVVNIRDEADILAARQQGKALALALGFSDPDTILIATAISEIARNILEHGGGRGQMQFRTVRNGARTGLEIIARDSGPGIRDIGLALQDGYSTRNGLGLGLPGARRLMDELDIHSAVGVGTTITMKKWVP